MKKNQSVATQSIYQHQYKTYINHTDAGGIVYHGNYMVFYENCRRDWFATLGFDDYFLTGNTIIDAEGKSHTEIFHPVVTDAQLKYLKPILLDMKIIVTIDKVKIRPASMIFHQSIYFQPRGQSKSDSIESSSNQMAIKLSTATFTIACVTHENNPDSKHNNANQLESFNSKPDKTNLNDYYQHLRLARLPSDFVHSLKKSIKNAETSSQSTNE